MRELTSKRTAVSRSWELTSGKRVTQIAAGPVQWKDEQGRWREFDLGVRPQAEGWEGSAGPMGVRFPARYGSASGEPIRVLGSGGEILAVELVGETASDGSTDGTHVVYSEVRPGVDVRLRLAPEGLKEDVVLDGPAAPRRLVYRLSLDAPDAQMTLDDDGGVRIAHGDRTLFRIPPPVMEDASGRRFHGDRYAIERVGESSWMLTLDPSADWLDARERSWPVVIDPTIVADEFEAPASEDCELSRITSSRGVTEYGPSCSPWETWRVGIDHNPTWSTVAYGAVRFDTLTLVPTDRVQSARLRLYRQSTYWLHNHSPIRVFGVNESWSRPTPTSVRAVFASATFSDRVPIASLADGPAGPMSTDVTAIVQDWQRHAETRGAAGRPNHGLLLIHADTFEAEYQPEVGCFYYYNSCDMTLVASSAFPAPYVDRRPVLEVTSLPAAPAGSEIVTPKEGHLTGRRAKLQVEASRSSVTSARFQYVAGAQRTWTDIPLEALRTATGAALGSHDIPVTGSPGDRRSQLAVWDLSAMRGGEVDGPVHVRAFLDSSVSGDGGVTDEVNFRLDRRGIDGSAAAPIGPGEVNLLSGELSISETDVSIRGFLQDLTLSRTYRSRGVSRRSADLFGPQWEASIEADGGELPYKSVYNYTEVQDEVIQRQALDPSAWNWELFFETFAFEDLGADIETFEEIRRWEYRYAVVECSDGSKMTFRQVVDPDGRVTGWEPDETHPGFRLAHAPGAGGVDTITLTEPSGGVAVFRSEAAHSPNYRLQTFTQPGSTTALSFSYATVGTRQRLTRVTAPKPTGGVARTLDLVWSDIGTPGISGTSSLPRVTAVRFSDGHYTNVTVAQYAYDDKARLVRAWDPRLGGSGLPTEYVYDSSSRLAEVRPPGEEEWRFTYTQQPGDEGPRLAAVARDHPGGGTATTTVRYDVPVSGRGAPYDLDYDQTRTWGQEDDLPWDAVAIFPEDDIPAGTDPDYSGATIYYLGLQGRAVNVATPGGHIATAEFDANGNAIRQLSATNRVRALDAGAGSAAVAQRLSTRFQYDANGVDLVATLEPETQIELGDGRAVTGRRLTSTHYDQGAPAGGPFHLPTSVWRAVETSPGNRVDERELVRNSYADGGWAARQATSVTVDPNGRALMTRRFLHPDYPIVEETRTPEGAAGGTSPDVQFYQYYGLAPSSRVPAGLTASGCSTYVGPSSPTGFLCLRSEATLPDAQVPRRWYDYNPLGLPVAIWEPRPLSYDGVGYRHTANGFDAAGRLTSTSTTGGTGTALPSTTFTYSTTTGRQTTVTASGRGTVRRDYDSNGRLAQYVDAGGTATTYEYDLRGRVTERVIDGARTTNYGYDARDNQTSVEDSEVGVAITATYGPGDELLSESLPNGVVGSFGYDETGRAQGITWEDTTDCASDCRWVESEVMGRDADGNITGHRSTESEQAFGYDSVQRLIDVDDVRLSDDRCVRRSYAYDVESNRTQRDVQTARAGDACGTGTVVTRGWTHDDADRVTNSGWTHDYFGRATAVPAADSGGTGALASAYYVNDYVRQMTLDGRTHTYDRDPLDRTRSIASSGASKPTITSTNRYADDGDAPVSVSRSDSTTATYIDGPSGQMVATKDDGTLTYQLRDVQGSVVAVTSDDGSEGRPLSRTETDEFGVVTTAAPNVIDDAKGVPANGWLGTHQRTTEFGQADGSGGPMQMGVRVYLPAVGRFLQVDPVDGGSANAYDYAWQNPMNMQDLSGECPICVVIGVEAGEIVIAAAAGVVATGVVYVATRDGALPTLQDIIRDQNPFKWAKGGRKNVKHTDHQHLSDAELEAAFRNKRTPKAEREKLRATMKGRGIYGRRKHGKKN